MTAGREGGWRFHFVIVLVRPCCCAVLFFFCTFSRVLRPNQLMQSVCRFFFIIICLQATDTAVSVTALRSSDGAILDPDDRLADVVDDREQLAACLAGEMDPASSMGGPGARLGMNLRGDGTSASSNSGSPSPDFLHHHYNMPPHHHQQQRKDIEVTGQEAGVTADHLHLQVRRGSEPALNRISPGPHSGTSNSNSVGHHLPEPSREYKVKHSFK